MENTCNTCTNQCTTCPNQPEKYYISQPVGWHLLYATDDPPGLKIWGFSSLRFLTGVKIEYGGELTSYCDTYETNHDACTSCGKRPGWTPTDGWACPELGCLECRDSEGTMSWHPCAFDHGGAGFCDSTPHAQCPNNQCEQIRKDPWTGLPCDPERACDDSDPDHDGPCEGGQNRALCPYYDCKDTPKSREFELDSGKVTMEYHLQTFVGITGSSNPNDGRNNGAYVKITTDNYGGNAYGHCVYQPICKSAWVDISGARPNTPAYNDYSTCYAAGHGDGGESRRCFSNKCRPCVPKSVHADSKDNCQKTPTPSTTGDDVEGALSRAEGYWTNRDGGEHYGDAGTWEFERVRPYWDICALRPDDDFCKAWSIGLPIPAPYLE